MGLEHVRVHLIDLPVSVHGFTIRVDCDSYDVFINARIGSDAQIRAYDHEMQHINNHDFDTMYNVNDLESVLNAG